MTVTIPIPNTNLENIPVKTEMASHVTTAREMTTTPLRMSWATIAMPSTRQTVLEPETTTAK